MWSFTSNKFEHEIIMKLTINFRHDFSHIFTDESILLKAKRLLNVIIAIENNAEVVADGIHCDYGDIFILTELALRNSDTSRASL